MSFNRIELFLISQNDINNDISKKCKEASVYLQWRFFIQIFRICLGYIWGIFFSRYIWMRIEDISQTYLKSYISDIKPNLYGLLVVSLRLSYWYHISDMLDNRRQTLWMQRSLRLLPRSEIMTLKFDVRTLLNVPLEQHLLLQTLKEYLKGGRGVLPSIGSERSLHWECRSKRIVIWLIITANVC